MIRICGVVAGLIALVAGLPNVFALDEQVTGSAQQRILAEADLSRLKSEAGDGLRVVWPTLRATPARVSGLRWTTGDASPEDTAAAFLEEFPGLTGTEPGDLELAETERTTNRTVLRFQQKWQGIRVLGGGVILSLDSEGRVLSMASSSARVDGLDPSRDIGRKAAVRAAVDRVHGEVAAGDARALAARVVVPGPGPSVLAWRVLVPTVPLVQKIVCLVDAATGEILKITDEVIR